MDNPSTFKGLPVPSQRLSRLWHLARATGNLAAGIGLRGMLELAQNRSGALTRVRLPPEHARRIADRLAHMRGAIMKLGQLVSMDGNDILTPESAEILASLRDSAQPMPIGQLNAVLSQELGADWDRRFRRFDFTPMAAASIGQVHRAETRDGRLLAIKIQFPGVRESIDSDIDNMVFLGCTLGLAPGTMDLAPLFEEARLALHREADYRAEAQSQERYADLVGDDPDFVVPRVHPDLCSDRVLAMDFAPGIPVDRLADRYYRHAERDRAARLLVRLLLRELFDFGLVQTDPNFSNYLYDPESGRLALLDFGATRPVAPALAAHYRRMAQASIVGDLEGVRESALALGYLDPAASPERAASIAELIALSGEPLRQPGPYDFGTSDLFERLYVRGRDLFFQDAFGRRPDPATFFLHRKFVGTFMLCRRLRARVDLGELAAGFL